MTFAIDYAGMLTGRHIDDPDLPTPFVYIDRDVLQANIDGMAANAARHGVALRPHTKSHKIAEIAQLQLAAGANGLTVAKLTEALALADAGVPGDVLIAQPYTGGDRRDWRLELARDRRVIVCVDSIEAVRGLGTPVEVAVIVDTGYGRLGLPPDEARALALAAAALDGVTLAGIRSHAGEAYGALDPAARAQVASHDAGIMRELAASLRAAGQECALVSVGSTPGTADLGRDVDFTGITEWRPGNYVFYDGMQVSIGVAGEADCALTAVVSVISAPRPGRALIDAGKKLLTASADPQRAGFGRVVGRPDVEIDNLSEECGWLAHTAPLAVGDRLQVIPNHSCELPNLVEAVAHGRDGVIEGMWTPVGRGKLW